jgi:cysteinyl-tRNA synthetase
MIVLFCFFFMLFLYSSLRCAKEAFVPMDDHRVRMYVCGPTVYDRIHLGNARCFLVFDILYRVLSVLFPRVDYVRNITDIDDKIINAARSQSVSVHDLTSTTISWLDNDLQDLGLHCPTHQPRATEFVPHMIAIIQRLLDQGVAYVVNGHVFFAVRKWPGYGTLCGASCDDMHAGARVDVQVDKVDPLDFVLWKPATPEQEGWDSPWGRGRPGWHIECSAMSTHFFGPVFDIHGGGRDLLFPHHENERAQTCAAFNGAECSRYWLHSAMLTVEGKKMAKSEGNFVTLRDALTVHRPEVLYWALATTHYRHALDWTSDVLHAANRCVDYVYNAIYKALPHYDMPDVFTQDDIDPDVLKALCDDLNTPKALSALHGLAGKVHKDPANKPLAIRLLNSAQWLGVVQRHASAWVQGDAGVVLTKWVNRMIEQRRLAKANKDYARADAIRHDLATRHIVLEDTPTGTTWRYVKQ